MSSYGSSDNDDDDVMGLVSFCTGPANNSKSGFFSQDRCSQTEESEVVALAELTRAMSVLHAQCQELQRRLNLTRGNLHSEFERKLQNKALDLYARMNDSVGAMEHTQLERVGVVRRAFKTQLTDALLKVRAMHDSNAHNQNAHDAKRDARADTRKDRRIKELEATLHRTDSVVTMLKLQIEELQAVEPEPVIVIQQAETPEPVYIERPETSVKYRQEDMDACHEEIAALKGRVTTLQEALDSGDATSGDLAAELSALAQQLADAHDANERLETECAELNAEVARLEEAAHSSHADRAAANADQAAAKAEQAAANEAQLAKARREAQARLDQELASAQQAELQRYGQLLAQKEALETRLQNERAAGQEQMEKLRDAAALAKREAALRQQLAALKAEQARADRAWEKKFAILRDSMHALKDEAYLRQQLQRQATALHQASVMYAADLPVTALSMSPGAGRVGRAPRRRQQQDALSYTVSVPGTAGTGAMLELGSDDEHQVLSLEEEAASVPQHLRPLPSPPRRAAVTSSAS